MQRSGNGYRRQRIVATSEMRSRKSSPRSLIGCQHPRGSQSSVFWNFQEGVSPGNGQPHRGNWEIVVPETMIGVQIINGVAAGGQTYIDAHRENELHQSRPVLS